MSSVSSKNIFRLIILCLILCIIPVPGSFYSQEQSESGIAQRKQGGYSFSKMNNNRSIAGDISALSESQKAKILKDSDPEDIIDIYEQADDSEKPDIIKLLSLNDRKNVFEHLSVYEKQKMFSYLDDLSKQELFKVLNDENRIIILDSLNHIEKSRLVSSLTEMELERWGREHPDIMAEIELDNISLDDSDIEEKAIKDDEKSRLEKIFSNKLPDEPEKQIRQFGYDYFSGKSSLSPVKYGPVSSDYTVGPGDSFTIHLWGREEGTYSKTITRSGTVTLPRLGTMSVSGMTFSELKTYLNNRFKEFYKDFEMSIAMESLRTVDVYMIGELNKPGTYNLTPLSTAISALFASGGPGKNGSLRNIKVLKDGKHIKTIDLYNFFMEGSKGDDVRLQQGYTVFVPVIGPVAGISGMVKRPAIFELKGEQNLGDLISLAGGILPTGHLQNVVVERISGHSRKVIKSFNLDPAYEDTDSNLKTVIKDGDLVKIFPIHRKKEEVVYLEGNVKYPREYELKSGMKVRDIIPSFDSLLPEPYLSQAEIIRLVPPDLHPEVRIFDLGAMLGGDEEENLTLSNQDRIVVYNAWEKMNLPEVTISGALRKPGVYRLYDGMTVKDLIFRAGNPTQSAFMERGELTRLVPGDSGMNSVIINFSPQKAIEGNPEDNLVLRKNDQVFIREIPHYASSLDKKITLEGEFKFPGEYSFAEGERLSSVIERAGGFTAEAYPYGAVFLRESVKDIEVERKGEYINRLEQDILTVGALTADTALDSSQASIALQALSAKKELLENLREYEPPGRMVIDVADSVLLPSGDNDLELRPGDRLIIGKRPDSVFIIGEVFNPNAMLYTKGKDVGYYLNLVGGMTDNADKKQVYIVKADGTVVSKKQGKMGLFTWDSSNHRWAFGSFDSMELLPGDTVIVPKKLVKMSWLKLLKDTTSVMYQIAVSGGVLFELFDD